MPAVANSILDDTKKALGLSFDYEAFDAEIIMHINSVIAELIQLGVGNQDLGYAIVNSQDTWDELIADEKRLNHVKSFVFLKVQMLFDPPSVGYVITAREKQIEEAQWRIMVAQDDIIHPLPPPIVVVDESDPFYNFG